MRRQRYGRWVPGAETACRKQNRRRAGQRGRPLLRGVLRHTAVARPPDSYVAVDLGRGSCCHQDCPSSFGTDCLQGFPLPSHHGQQVDRPPAFRYSSYGVLVHCSHRHRGRCRHVRSRAGRALHQEKVIIQLVSL